MKHYMIVDIGTGNSRVALVREDGALICVKTFENIYYIDEAYEDAQYFDPSFWKRNILGLCREIIHMYPNITIDAISSSGARESIVLINRKQEDFYGLPNIDNRGKMCIRDSLCLIQVVVRESMLQMQCRTGDKGDIRKILLQRICRPIPGKGCSCPMKLSTQ